MTDWTDKEARKVRAEVAGWAAATVRTPQSLRNADPARAYAAALGVTLAEAHAKIKAHEAHLEAFRRSENQAPARAVIDATGPTDWNRKGADSKSGKDLRSRVLASIDKRFAPAPHRATDKDPRYFYSADAARFYADLMGWDFDRAEATLLRQINHLDTFHKGK